MLELLLSLLKENPILLLFVIAAAGHLLGQIRIAGIGVGVAAVLFVGLAVGSLDPNLKLPEFVNMFGLSLFIYSVGLGAGPTFLASFKASGIRDNVIVVSVLIFAAVFASVAHAVFSLKSGIVAGMFTGSLTNTPALAGVLDLIRSHAPTEQLESLLAEPVVGYSVAYPVGVLSMMLTLVIAQRLMRVDYAAEAKALSHGRELLVTRTIRVRQANLNGQSINQLIDAHHWRVLFGRYKRGDETFLSSGETHLKVDDLVTIVGPAEDIELVCSFLGEYAATDLTNDRSAFDTRRMFVSRADLAGRKLADLNLRQSFSATVTRIRRGDTDLLADPDTTLELGDRVRVLAPRTRMDEITAFFGDSYKAVSEIDIASFGIGIALGVLLGMLPFPLPGGHSFKLGFAGGPLIVGLIFGVLGRTGRVNWAIPYSANLTLRQVGLILFLAGVGLRSGYAFASTLAHGGALPILICGALIPMVAGSGLLFIGHRILKIPFTVLGGLLAGLQTQPALLAFVQQQTKNDYSDSYYTNVFPASTLTKIILAQLLFGLGT